MAKSLQNSLSRALIGVTVLAVTGCFPAAGGIPEPVSPSDLTRAQADYPAVTDVELAQGRQLFIDRCGSCHNHSELQAHSKAEWTPIMERMGRKADMSRAETALALQFIVSRLRPRQ